jgi:hypothetical protein
VVPAAQFANKKVFFASATYAARILSPLIFHHFPNKGSAPNAKCRRSSARVNYSNLTKVQAPDLKGLRHDPPFFIFSKTLFVNGVAQTCFGVLRSLQDSSKERVRWLDEEASRTGADRTPAYPPCSIENLGARSCAATLTKTVP